MKKATIAITYFFIMALILSACSIDIDKSVDEHSSTESTVESSVQELTPEILLALTTDEITEMRDKLHNAEFSNLLPEERYNLLILDYYLDWDSRIAKPSLRSSVYTLYPFNQEIENDLNGDGKLDKIIVTLSDSGVMLKINDQEIDCLYSGENTLNGFAIINIDYDDDYKEIVISDTGYSADDTSRCYCYDGVKIIYMNEGANINRPMPETSREGAILDEIGGLFTYIEKGNGKISTIQRSATLQTWWYPLRYELTSGHLLQVVPEIFKVNYEVFVLMDMALYKERSDTSPTINMKKGTLVKITALDDIEWIQIRLDDGQKGWFKIKDHDIIVVKGEEIKASDIFFHLFYAD